jgi:hypothetical protein
MTRRTIVAALLGLTSFAMGQDEPLPKAETLLDRNVEVTGGKAAYQKRKNEVATGMFEFAAQGLKGSLTRYSAEPAEEYLITDIEGVGKIEQGMHNGVAWDKNPMMGPRIKSGAEKLQSVRESTFNSAIHWRDLYSKVETTGTETIDGELCYKVVLTPKEGNPETTFYQKKSGLAVKTMMVAVNQMGEVPSEVFAGDFKTFNGIMQPTKLIYKAAGQEFTLTIQDVKINQPMSADRFEPPAEIKALMNKAADKK